MTKSLGLETRQKDLHLLKLIQFLFCLKGKEIVVKQKYFSNSRFPVPLHFCFFFENWRWKEKKKEKKKKEGGRGGRKTCPEKKKIEGDREGGGWGKGRET